MGTISSSWYIVEYEVQDDLKIKIQIYFNDSGKKSDLLEDKEYLDFICLKDDSSLMEYFSSWNDFNFTTLEMELEKAYRLKYMKALDVIPKVFINLPSVIDRVQIHQKVKPTDLGEFLSLLSDEICKEKLDDYELMCSDNFRLAKEDVCEEVRCYKLKRSNGCCGYFDKKIIVNKTAYLVGFNYGH
jgi:hypothetical protein